MKPNTYFIIAFFVFFCSIITLKAQYPDISKEVREAEEKIILQAEESSELAWQKALPTIKEEAKHGKPYIPWAERATDLPQSTIPAFPGAEGGGMYTFGGRGGKVIVVTSLEDSGPGTFREACETGGARIIVFNVAGIIRLKSPLIIRAPYVTIAGQTAPGDGICIAGESVWINTHDVIIRYMRFRRGETWVGRRDDALGGNPVGNIMIDHVSASWGLDENMTLYKHMYDEGIGKPAKRLPTVNITIQNSIFSEALDTYNHGFGSTLGGENCMFARNLWANNTGRNPSMGAFGVFNFTNNVVYNWVHRSTDGGDYTSQFNIINNYYKPGPASKKNEPVGHRIIKPEAGRSTLGYYVFGHAYVVGNIMEGYPEITSNNWNGGVQVEELEELPDCDKYCEDMKWDKPFPMPPVTIMSAQDAYDFVLANAGATLPKRDPVDTRIVTQVNTNTIDLSNYTVIDSLYQFPYRRMDKDSYKVGIITDIAQVGGYPVYNGQPYKDSDNDGMPDKWEIKYKLNPNNPADAIKDMNEDGYTNIEKYINGIDPDKEVDWTDLKNNKETLTVEDIINY